MGPSADAMDFVVYILISLMPGRTGGRIPAVIKSDKVGR
jgi:hypothetical protein